MSDSFWDSENRLDEAISAYNSGDYSSASAVARKFHVDSRTLRRRLNGGASKSTRSPSNKALTDAQEKAICAYIERLDHMEQSAKLSMVRGAANYLLGRALVGQIDRDQTDTPPPTVSAMWTRRFLKCHPEYFKRKKKPLAVERKHSHDSESMIKHFEQYKLLRELRGIVDEDTWNMDETGFRIGCGKAHWVISTHSHKPLLMKDPDNRDYITSVESSSGGGRDIPPMIILPGVQIKEKWALENDLDDDILFAVSSTGYSNDDLAIDWLKHFDKHSAKGQIGAWRLLILDGYGSHMTYEFFEYAQSKHIELFRLPAHSTHLTQPLDVGWFQPFKHYHAEAIDKAIRAGGGEFNKIDFLSIFQDMRLKTFTKSTILAAFRNTGLVPYNPNVVISKIEAQSRQRPTTPPPPPSAPLLARTSRTSTEVIIFGTKLQRSMQTNDAIDGNYRLRVDRFFKGAMASAHAQQLAERDLLTSARASIAKAARKKLAGTVAQSGGVITVRDVRAKITKRHKNKVEKAQKVLHRAKAAALKKQQVIDNAEKKLWKVLFREANIFLRACKKWEVERTKWWEGFS